MIVLWLLRHWPILHRPFHRPYIVMVDGQATSRGSCWVCAHAWRQFEKDPEFLRQMERAGHR